MPRLSVWFVRVALTCLLVGVAIGAWFLPQPGAMPRAWLYVHLELLFVGWFFHLAFGVAAWILPRARTEPRMGNPRLGWSSFALLFTGTALAIAMWMTAVTAPGTLFPRILQLTGCGLFIAFIRPRIRSFGD